MDEILEYEIQNDHTTHKKIDPVYFKVPRLAEETVKAEMWDLQYFYDPIHYHEECQITFIIESEGMLFIGDRLTKFHRGELFVIGSNTPHVFRHENAYYQGQTTQHARAISIFFNSESILNIINDLPESSSLHKLMENAKYGFKIETRQAAKLKGHIKNVLNTSGMERVIELLTLLNKLSIQKDLEILMTKTPMILEYEDGQKLDKVFTYIMESYREKITLEEVAALINITPSAFCRYFKHRTQKTFSRFLIEVRIGKACKMLLEGENVAEACYSSGYNNISNFHRHFKRIMALTPNEYKRTIQKRA
ncbi:MAG TPA: AraC family transcriptional regulator [Bacteroides sp.]|nr:AraC family transcriptional regulator [Bacteroides sp.]